MKRRRTPSRAVGVIVVLMEVWILPYQALAQPPTSPFDLNVRTTQSGSTLNVTWDPVSSAGFYSVTFYVGSTTAAGNRITTLITDSPELALNIPAGTAGTFTVSVGAFAEDAAVLPESGSATFTVGGECAAPAAPSGVTGVRIARISNIRTDVRWLGDPSATRYTLLVGTSPAATNLFVGDVGNTTTVGSDAVDPNTPLYIRVIANNACGSSPPSSELFLAPGATTACAADPRTMCLFDGRFVVHLSSLNTNGALSPALVTRRFNDGGGFSFGPGSEDLFVRMIDRCAATGRYEVRFENRSGFPASTGFELLVGHPFASFSRAYRHNPGTQFVSFTDGGSFFCQ